MSTFNRILPIELPAGRSAFLWGPRKTGKSFLLRRRFPQSAWFDLLDTDLMLALAKRPAVLRERVDALPSETLRHPIVIDEVQKVPQVLDEVHRLIEERGLSFILSGSSARKLKRGRANLLGGRAWRFELHPLTTPELGVWDLQTVLQRGLLPDHYLSTHPGRSLRAYIKDYLKEEVFAEGLSRNIPAFARFFDAMAYTHGELVNYSSIARDCGVDSKTVREYFQILVDTLLGRFVEPYKARQGRAVLTKTPRFYLFDVGVAGAVVGRRMESQRGEAFGRALEHFVFMELVAHASYRELDCPIRYWRTRSGLEVDFVLGDAEVAIEVKGASRLDRRDLHGLRAFLDDHRPRQAIVVCCEPAARTADGIRVLPVAEFLAELWADRVIA